MISVSVCASKNYDVLIERGLLDKVGQQLRAVSRAETAVIVAGDIVFPLYGQRVEASLQKAGFRTLRFVIRHGEQSKSLSTYGDLLQFLSNNHLTRSDALVALGGGVAGDLTGFTAATYQRGMDYIQVPTTLLAAVDSSVGGKTALNLESGKNQVGTIYQPAAVLCDPEIFASLPEEEYRCGCAEIIKYAVLGSERFFEQLKETPVRLQEERVIKTCVEMKRNLVQQDEFDHGARRLLNLGHSVGHAVEACSGYQILHGQAVAIGMAVMARAAAEKGICSRVTAEEIEAILRQYGLPTQTEYSLNDLAEAVSRDKKTTGGTMHLVVPEKIGHCRIEAVPVNEVREWMRLGGVK